MRVVAISDLHIGQGESLKKFIRACNWVKSRNPDVLVVNGDIAELLWFSLGGLLDNEPLDTFECLRRMFQGVPKVFWVVGNHDPRELQLDKLVVEHFPGVEVVDDLFLDGAYYFHGHQLDETVRLWGILVKIPGVRRMLPWLYRRLYGSPYANFLRTLGLAPPGAARSVENYNLFVDRIFSEAIVMASNMETTVIFGHTHKAQVAQAVEHVWVTDKNPNIWVANSGSWGRPGWEAIEVIDGGPKLYNIAPLIEI